MDKTMVLAAAALALGAGAAGAQPPVPVPFEQAVYVTCRDGEDMEVAKRIALVRSLAEHAGNHFGVRFRDEDKLDRELAAMIRAGCTMFPSATVFFIVSAAVKAEAEKLRGGAPAR